MGRADRNNGAFREHHGVQINAKAASSKDGGVDLYDGRGWDRRHAFLLNLNVRKRRVHIDKADSYLFGERL